MTINRIIGKIVRIHPFPTLLIKPVLNLHSFCYSLATILVIQLHKGVHPKHQIIRYEDWFRENIYENDVVVDLGCKFGHLAKHISDKAKHVYGIDFDANSIELAKNNYSADNIKYICGDATKFDYNKLIPIDVVILSNVLEHIDQRVAFLKQLSETIIWKNSPRLLLRVPMIDRDWITVFKQQLGVEHRLDNTHFIEYTFEIFADELNRAGFKINSFHIQYGELYAVCIGKSNNTS